LQLNAINSEKEEEEQVVVVLLPVTFSRTQAGISDFYRQV
jgi:UDP-N-acetylmuramate-alanine ligase